MYWLLMLLLQPIPDENNYKERRIVLVYSFREQFIVAGRRGDRRRRQSLASVCASQNAEGEECL